MRHLDDTNVEARRLELRVYAALERWVDAAALLEEWDSAMAATDTLAAKFLPDDVVFFTAQRELVAEWHRAQVADDARQHQLSALRLAKQDVRSLVRLRNLSCPASCFSRLVVVLTQEIWRAILKRDNAGMSLAYMEPQEPLRVSKADDSMRVTRLPKCSGLVANASGTSVRLMTTTAQVNNRCAIHRSEKRVKDPQTERIRRGRVFARTLRTAAADHDALAALLVTTPLATLSDALDTALSDAQLLLLFDAFVALAAQEDAAASVQAALGLLTGSKRLWLAVEMMGSDEQREKLRVCADSSTEAASAVNSRGDIDTAFMSGASGATCA